MLMPQKFSNLIKLYGFSLLRNGVKYDYSFRESFLSLAGIAEEVYISLDNGEDNSFDEVEKIPNMKIVPSSWDMNLKKGLVLSVETNKSLSALREVHGAEDNAWAIYLQADEVLHEDDYQTLINDIEMAEKNGCDAISFCYLHFWQTHHHIAISKKWYPHEIRAIKLKSNITSWGDAQGFKNYTKIYFSEARIFHYGHVREQSSYKDKMREMGKMYHDDKALEERLKKGLKDADNNVCIFYFGSHPIVMKDRILRMNDIWELDEIESLCIVGNKEKYSQNLINLIKAKKITWCSSHKQVPKDYLGIIVTIEPSWFDRYFKKMNAPKKMNSKLAREWGHDFRLVVQLSEKGVGIRHD
jgi:hypothetical protein